MQDESKARLLIWLDLGVNVEFILAVSRLPRSGVVNEASEVVIEVLDTACWMINLFDYPTAAVLSFVFQFWR